MSIKLTEEFTFHTMEKLWYLREMLDTDATDHFWKASTIKRAKFPFGISKSESTAKIAILGPTELIDKYSVDWEVTATPLLQGHL